MKKIGVLVLNNFLNDNRVHKIACSLSGAGHRVTVIAFLKGNVQEFEKKDHYQVHRIRLRASSLPNGNKLFGALKYLEFIFKIVRFNETKPPFHTSLIFAPWMEAVGSRLSTRHFIPM